MRRRTVVLLSAAGVVCAAVSWLVFLGYGTSATAELERRFDIHATDVETIRAGLLTKVRVGAPEDAVVEFLQKSGVGSDSQSWWERKDGEIRCGLEYEDRRPYWMSGEMYRIHFEFDDARLLRDVRVTKSIVRL